ncbi:MAG TPA: toll/interleukin-1 receptor domain-containing protein, partial [Pyrinomonadaceae bacterium]|nr:toll/interleukin-1 receptor domain-containing protein [Pyrinomonadaceae bacterium]
RGPLLVFPSQLTRVNPDLPDPEGQTVTFAFEGALLNVYATLAVRLSHSGLFRRREMWKNAAVYSAAVGGSCGVLLRELDEGRGELTLFFDARASAETIVHFEEFVYRHLQRRAVPDSINVRRTAACRSCRTPVTELQAARRKERGFDWIACGVCDARVELPEARAGLESEPSSAVREMNRAADARLATETAVSVLQGKIKTGDFDVFLCHNAADKPAVRDIGERLKQRGILPWLDEEQLRPGLRWQDELEQQVEKIKAAAVFVGASGLGPWQQQELSAFLREFAGRQCPVIPVLLPDCPQAPNLPVFLKGFTWVDFRKALPDPLEQLVYGITGRRDGDS